MDQNSTNEEEQFKSFQETARGGEVAEGGGHFGKKRENSTSDRFEKM